ncbi:MAG: hypothetical protein AAGI07_01205 [Bacteroidota bacterium]
MSSSMNSKLLMWLSWGAVLLFLPSFLIYNLTGKAFTAFFIQGVVGITAGIMSGYFWDSVLSCLLVGVIAFFFLALISIWFTQPSIRIYLASMGIAICIFLINIFSHDLGERPNSFFIQLFIGTLVVSISISYLSQWLVFMINQISGS